MAYGIHSLAWDYWRTGRYAESEQLCRPVQKIVNYALGENNSIAADSSYYLAECLRCQGKNEEAASLYKKALQQMQQFLGGNHVYVADASYNLGRVYDAQEQYQDAQKLYYQAIDIYVKQYPKYPSIAHMRNRLAILMLKQGHIEQAQKELQEAIRIDQLYGKMHRGVAENLNDLACVFYHKQDWQAAYDTLQKSLVGKMKYLGQRHHSLYVTFYNLAAVSRKLQKEEEALKYDELAHKIFRHRFPESQVTDGNERAKMLYKEYHYQYEVPNIFTRSNVTVELQGNY